jgi:hypothetical protein
MSTSTNATSGTSDVASASSSSGAGGASSKQGFESGSRLKARILTGDDGSEARVGFFDSMRNENCVYRKAIDNSQRCMPSDQVAYVGTYYGDAFCGAKLAYSPCGPPAYAYEQFGTSCIPPVKIYSISSTPFSGQVYVGVPGNCVQTTGPGSLYVVLAEIAPTEFVQGTETLAQ